MIDEKEMLICAFDELMEKHECLERRHFRYFDSIGKQLEKTREYRNNGEVKEPDCREVMKLAQFYIANKGKKNG